MRLLPRSLALTCLASLVLAGCLTWPGCSSRRGPKSRGPGQPESALSKYEINQKKHPKALCNDGSTPIFYMRKGAERDKWVIWFKGGGACFDIESCERRDLDLKSTKPWKKIDRLTAAGNPASTDGGANGILAADPAVNPDFHRWNHVYLVYCSSDMWSGSRAASKETGGLHFRGHDIATAMIDALSDKSIVGDVTIDEATEVILSGSSAGATGVRNNLDRLAAMMPKKAKVRGFSDAAVTPSRTPVRAEGDEAAWRARLAFWGAKGDESCERAHPGDELWMCLEGRVLAEEGHLQTPTFFHMDQRDPVMMGKFDPRNPEQFALSREAAEEVRDLMAKQSGAFCPANANHILLNHASFNRAQAAGYTAAEVFGNWYFDRKGPKVVIEEAGEDPARGGGRERKGAPTGGDDQRTAPDGRPTRGPGGRRNPTMER